MENKAKYLAEIESRMSQFNTTIESITQKAKMRNETRPAIDLDGIRRKHEDARLVYTDLKSSDHSKWEKTKAVMDDMVGDIDNDLREALAYFS